MFSKMLVSAVTATALLSTLPAFARDLKLADFHSPSHFIVEEVYEPFANAVSEATGGDLTVRLYMEGSLAQAQTSSTIVLSMASLISSWLCRVTRPLHFH